MKLMGFYNEYGYRIMNENEVELYSAGNNPYDSQQMANLDIALPLTIIKDFCETTINDLSEEFEADIVGIEYDEISD